MNRWWAGLLAGALLSLVVMAVAVAQTGPQFRLGFKVLADLIPGAVGQPLEDENYNPVNGDSLQRTTTGLMVWRKADNWTAFTDGNQTWINGPEGVQVRSNADRFPWEQDQTPVPGPAGAPPVAVPPAMARLTPLNVAQMEAVASLKQLSADGRPLQISRVAFSPDGTLLATAAYRLTFEADPNVKLWDVASAREVATLGDQKGWVLAIAFSPDGRFLASGGTEGVVRLWDVGNGRVVQSLNWPEWTWVESLAFSPDGSLLASGSSGGSVKLWNVATEAEVRTLTDPAWNWVFSVAFSPDGRLLAVGGWDGMVKLIEVASGRMVRALPQQQQVREVVFSPDGTVLASASRDKTVALFEVATGKGVGALSHPTYVYGAAYSPDGKLLASVPGGRVVYLWDTTTGKTVRGLVGHSAFLTSVAFSPDGLWLASSDTAGEVKLWGVKP